MMGIFFERKRLFSFYVLLSSSVILSFFCALFWAFLSLYPWNNLFSLLLFLLSFLSFYSTLYIYLHLWRDLIPERKTFLLGIYYSMIIPLIALGFWGGLHKSFPLDQIPSWCFYRYLCTILLLLFLLLSPLGWFRKSLPWFSFRFPSTHFFYAFLGSWVENPWNSWSSSLIKAFPFSPRKFHIFVFFHILFVSFLPLLSALVFLLSIFFFRDLSFYLLFLPLSLLSLGYSLFYDYFSSFVRENLSTISLYLKVSYQGSQEGKGVTRVDVKTQDLLFSLSPEGEKEGHSLEILKQIWFPLASTLGLLNKLEERKFFSYSISLVLSLRLVAFLYLCFLLFPSMIG